MPLYPNHAIRAFRLRLPSPDPSTCSLVRLSLADRLDCTRTSEITSASSTSKDAGGLSVFDSSEIGCVLSPGLPFPFSIFEARTRGPAEFCSGSAMDAPETIRPPEVVAVNTQEPACDSEIMLDCDTSTSIDGS